MAEQKIYVGGRITIKPRPPEDGSPTPVVAKIEELAKDQKAEKEKAEKGG